MAKQTRKPWYKSSTLWINIVPVAAMLLDVVIQNNLIPDPEYLALVQALLNILNRFRAPAQIAKLSR